MRGVAATPLSARSIAGARQRSSPSRPKRAARSLQAATAPGTVIDRGPELSTPPPSSRAGERPEPFRPTSSPSHQSCANASPPIPVSGGSATVRTAAAVSAASTEFPPSSSARTPACVASGWLVATSARRVTVGRREKPLGGSVLGAKRRSARSSTSRPYRASASGGEVREQGSEQRPRAGERQLDPPPLHEHAEAGVAHDGRRQHGEPEQCDGERGRGEEEQA